MKVARQIDTDLVVVGSTALRRSEGGLGSVTLGALTLTDASVLIVPSSAVPEQIDASALA
jgi:nucleotide-binding universal stress UspA family protein